MSASSILNSLPTRQEILNSLPTREQILNFLPTKQTALDTVNGWAGGHQYAQYLSKTKEITQGKNYLLAVPVLACQNAVFFGTIVYKLVSFLPETALKTAAKVACNIAPLVFLPVNYFFATVAQGNYKKDAEWWNAKFPLKLPENLGPLIKSISHFFAEYSSDMLRVAMIVGSIAIIALGCPYFGGATLVALAYEAIDSRGWIPRKISLFMERYMTIVSLTGLAIAGGSIIIQIGAIIALPSHIFPSFSKFIQQKIDLVARKCFKITGRPALQELEAPLVEKKNLSFNDIQQILNAEESQFELNPAHFSKSACHSSDFPRNRNFEEFSHLFEKINWEEHYPVVFRKLADDRERFIDFLANELPDVVKKEELLLPSREDMAKKYPELDVDALNIKIREFGEERRQKIDSYIETLAKKQNMTKEQYAAHFIKKNMRYLIDLLKGKIGMRVAGQQQDLDEAIENCSIILPHLHSLFSQGKMIELEDALLKLSVEGNYCGRGIKVVSHDIVRGILQEGIKNVDPEAINPIKDYEVQIRQSLQNQRQTLVEKTFQTVFKDAILSKFPNTVKDDVHFFDAYRIYLTFGFIPLTKYERESIGVAEIISWEFYSHFYQHMLKDYDPYAALKEKGMAELIVYLRKVLGETLTEEEINQVFSPYEEADNLDGLDDKFRRLVLVMLGVLRKKPSPFKNRKMNKSAV